MTNEEKVLFLFDQAVKLAIANKPHGNTVGTPFGERFERSYVFLEKVPNRKLNGETSPDRTDSV